MGTALYTKTTNVGGTRCPYRPEPAIRWSDDLPTDLNALVVTPQSFTVFQDYDMQADHTQGCDAANEPCFSEFRFVVTQLRSDDDEVFYDVPVYAESLTSWRLVDERWLNCKTTVEKFNPNKAHTHLYLSDTMPR